MPILPLPQFEADLEEDRKIYERLKPPSSIVVRFGLMKMVGEFPYSGDAKPGCGSKIVVRTHRGTELGEMLTSTCPNSGCSKSVSRKEMLEYIENSGGKDYPFFSHQGKVLRIATAEDLNEQARIDGMRQQMIRFARALSERMSLPLKIVDAEPILGGEKLTFFFTSEQRIDFRDLVGELAQEYRTRIEMRQVGARDEARLVADYEKCGQYCCCKNFLKVLKPVSMKSAKIQKATLDPLKISGRCGRLMCCLRYEDETYDELRARLPKRKTRVKTPDGWGIVLDSQILTQLVLVQLESRDEQIAVAVEDLLERGGPARPGAAPDPEEDGPTVEAGEMAVPARNGAGAPGADRRGRERRPGPPQRQGGRPQRDGATSPPQPEGPTASAPPSESGGEADPARKKRRRRRRRGGGGGNGDGGGDRGPGEGGAGPGPTPPA